MSENNSDLELINRLANGGEVTSNDFKSNNSKESNSLRSLTEGAKSVTFELSAQEDD